MFHSCKLDFPLVHQESLVAENVVDSCSIIFVASTTRLSNVSTLIKKNMEDEPSCNEIKNRNGTFHVKELHIIDTQVVAMFKI